MPKQIPRKELEEEGKTIWESKGNSIKITYESKGKDETKTMDCITKYNGHLQIGIYKLEKKEGRAEGTYVVIMPKLKKLTAVIIEKKKMEMINKEEIEEEIKEDLQESNALLRAYKWATTKLTEKGKIIYKVKEKNDDMESYLSLYTTEEEHLKEIQKQLLTYEHI
mmetsp:Transcript_12525/g.18757  ORF Transcript_12525/g.18757 Transcript_12525/m.18757 type:complete len:166 (+) Transcript_12525:123-620(+)